MSTDNETEKNGLNFIFKVFDLIDFPLKGKSGRRNVLVLTGFYLVLFFVFIFSSQDKIPLTLLYIGLLFPFVFVTVALVLLAIRSGFGYLFRRLPKTIYVVVCALIFLAWTFLMAWLTYILRPLGKWHEIPLWFLPMATIIVVCGYFSFLIVWRWYLKIDSYKTLFTYLFIHFLMYVPVLGVMVLEKQFNLLTVDRGYSVFQASLLLLSFQYLFYCLISFYMLLRKLLFGIRYR